MQFNDSCCKETELHFKRDEFRNVLNISQNDEVSFDRYIEHQVQFQNQIGTWFYLKLRYTISSLIITQASNLQTACPI